MYLCRRYFSIYIVNTLSLVGYIRMRMHRLIFYFVFCSLYFILTQVLLQGGVTFREVAYHRNCFLCTGCGNELANVKFATKDEQPYCPDCYIKNFAKICEKCEKAIAGECTFIVSTGDPA